MTLDDMIRQALHDADDYEPSPDLFERVQRSIADTRAHRRRVAVWVLGVTALIVVLGAALALSVESVDGVLRIARWRMELIETVVSVALLVLVGPLVRRFGHTYLAAVVPRAADRGRSLLAMLDIAYYLVFAAMVLVGADLTADPVADPGRLAVELADAATRVASLAFRMGVLHAATLLVLPLVGLLLTAASWRSAQERRGGFIDPAVARIDRVAGRLAWALVAVAVPVPVAVLVVLVAVVGI